MGYHFQFVVWECLFRVTGIMFMTNNCPTHWLPRLWGCEELLNIVNALKYNQFDLKLFLKFRSTSSPPLRKFNSSSIS